MLPPRQAHPDNNNGSAVLESGFRQAQLRSRSSLLIADPASVTQL
jgi:hypothetical protein